LARSCAAVTMTCRESLRYIEACLRSVGGKLYHMEFRGKVAHSTSADANESNDWRMYVDFVQILIPHRSSALCPRSDRCRFGPELICVGLHEHPTMPIFIPVGQIS
jgi:hypothetical protein